MVSSMAEFVVLLQHLREADNAIRSHAESQYKLFLIHQPDAGVTNLLMVIQQAHEVGLSVSYLATVLLRQCLVESDESLWLKLSPSW